MAKVKVVGGSAINVSQKVGEKILQWKKEKKDPKMLVDLGGKDFVELSQIKGVDFQELKTNDPIDIARNEKIKANLKDWDEYVAKCKNNTVEEKAKRVLKSFCALLWTARGNRPVNKLPEDISDLCMMRLLEYFEKNPNEWHATEDIYQDLIPFEKIANISKVEGMKTIGEAMQAKLV